jgi:A/G-specific adenine glycosylase
VLQDGKEIIVRKRTDNDIWKGLYELPMMESPKPIRKDLQKKLKEYLGLPCTITSYSRSYTQQLSHQTIQSVFIFLSDVDIQKITHEGWQRISLKNLHSLGFPKVVHLFLQENSLL